MNRTMLAFLFASAVAAAPNAAAGKAPEKGKAEETGPWKAATFTGLAFRSIGPALTSGRISDLAVDPTNHDVRYAAAASGGVWKTGDAGVTWTPVFDHEGSYSIGCVTVDPNRHLTVWVGSGENNSQRSVAYGDGVYRSVDGGASWENMGLKNSEHIGMIVVDPRGSDTVYVAAQGPLWGPGGDRGLYKTVDGGKTWKQALKVDENTGVSDIALDPRDPDVIYATSYQRRRRVWTLIDGGPGSAVYKSTDGGATWNKIDRGLPAVDLGRIGLAVSPVNPDVVYALVEASDGKSGFYRSEDAGSHWKKRSDYSSSSPQYYQEIVADPVDVDKVYSMDTFIMVTEDGGKSFHRMSARNKHVDNHLLWIDPTRPAHMINGCDGGLYETRDGGENWLFFANLPVTQFYKLDVDNDQPYYNVYGGTQDNNTLGGPSRTASASGIVNSDWFVTTGGDGFQSRVDPADPDIVYSESQYGGLVRYDRKNGERVDIQPQPAPGKPPLRWNWDSPLIVSPHAHTRIYFAANRLFRSDDRGDHWTAVSPDLTRQIDRNRLTVMGKVWTPEAVAKDASTSFYGTVVSLSESPAAEGVLYAGCDDGLIQVTEDGGKNWRKIERVDGVPDGTYVSYLAASRFDGNTVYATFDNHKNADFKPYVARSADLGRSWTSISGDLPARGSAYCLAEDSKDPNLLFVGTEFGVFFTGDGGKHWVQLKGGLPVIAVRDLAVQARENDLVLATFGRGFYVLDDYTPLRGLTPAQLEAGPALFPVKPAWTYVERRPLGGRGKASQGDAFYTAPNPPFGATLTYYLKEKLQTLKEKRQAEEKKAEKAKSKAESAPPYPGWDELTAEAREPKPEVLLTVTDEDRNVVRRLTGATDSGFHRVSWDLRYPPSTPVREPHGGGEEEEFGRGPTGPMAAPGRYTVSLARRVEGKETPLGEPRTFEVRPLGTSTLPPADRDSLLAFERRTARLQRAVLGAVRAASEASARIGALQQAWLETPNADPALRDRAQALMNRLEDIQVKLTGDPVRSAHNAPQPPSISGRVSDLVYGGWNSTGAPTGTQRDAYCYAAQEFAPVLGDLRTLVETDLRGLENEMEAAGAPWTPGRVPVWKPE